MALDRAALSVYLDELDADPLKACEIARSLGLGSVCLRRVWSTNIGKATDDACKQIMVAVKRNKLDVLAVCTDDGRVPAEQLAFDQGVKRSITIAAYFKARFFRPLAGLKAQRPDQAADDKINAWASAISGECTRAILTPLLEIDPDAHTFEPADVAAFMSRHPTWRLLYDPALLIIKRNQNPLVRYWHLLKGKIALIDLHDFKIGSGFVPVGAGNCFFEETLRDCLTIDFGGPLVIEPGATRRTGITTPKPEMVKAAIANYIQMIAHGRSTIATWANQKKGQSDAKKRQRRTT